jgi:hypothetical protein
LKAATEKYPVTSKGKPIKITDLSTATLKDGRAWYDVFQMLKEDNWELAQ